jgi:uncharacterized protein YjaZ
VKSNNFHVSNAGGTLDHHLGAIGAAFVRAQALAIEPLGIEGIEVIFLDAPDEAIPEWGVGGTTWSPNVIIVALDPTFPISETHIVATLVHEFHHAMRWRGPGCGGNLGQMLVSEGLAQLFEEEVLGEAPFFSATNYTDEHVAQAELALFDPAFSQSKWFFGSEELPRFFGYAYGYRLSKEYATSSGRKASELVNTPSDKILGFETTTSDN